MIPVYRVESIDGFGPHSTMDVKTYEVLTYQHHSKPLPCNDGIHEDLSINHIFGFRSLQQAIDWFGYDALKRFYRLDCYLYVYLANPQDISFGYNQLVFLRNKAVLWGKIENF